MKRPYLSDVKHKARGRWHDYEFRSDKEDPVFLCIIGISATHRPTLCVLQQVAIYSPSMWPKQGGDKNEQIHFIEGIVYVCRPRK